MKHLKPLLALVLTYLGIFAFGYLYNSERSQDPKPANLDYHLIASLSPEVISNLGKLDRVMLKIIDDNNQIRMDPERIIEDDHEDSLRLLAHASAAAISVNESFIMAKQIVDSLDKNIEKPFHMQLSDTILEMKTLSNNNFLLFLSVMDAKLKGNISAVLKTKINMINETTFQIESVYLEVSAKLQEYLGIQSD